MRKLKASARFFFTATPIRSEDPFMSEPVSWERRPSQTPGQPDAYFSSDGSYAILPASGRQSFALVWLGTTGVAGYRQVGSFTTLESAMRRGATGPRAEPAPATIKVAMLVAIAGAAVGAALSLLFTGPTFMGKYVNPEGIALFAWFFVVLNLTQVAINAGLLRFMLRRSTIAWILALTLVTIGALVDVAAEFAAPASSFNSPALYLSLVDLGMVAVLGIVLNPPIAVDVAFHWTLIHFLGVQLPILALLVLPASRRWCRAPW